jgi:hypothetical protein
VFDEDFEAMEFASRFEAASGHNLEDLASRYRETHQIRGRIEFVTLALPRYGFRGRDVATLLEKHGNSITKWLTQGLPLERDDPAFKDRLHLIDAAISSADRQINKCAVAEGAINGRRSGNCGRLNRPQFNKCERGTHRTHLFRLE